MSQRISKPLTENEVVGLWALFGPPPVLSTENQQAYDKIRGEYVAHYRPKNAVQLRAIREVVDCDWEIFRFIRHRAVGIERHFRKSIDNQVLRLRSKNEQNKERVGRLPKYTPNDIAQLSALESVIAKTEADVEELLKRQPLEIDHNRALEQGAEFFDHVDRWLNSATARRNAALQLVEYCCGPSPDNREVIETEYEEVGARQIEHTPSSSLAPAEVVAHDVATRHSSESLKLAKE